MHTNMRSTSVRISAKHARELRLLKEAWKKRSIDEVLEELIEPRRIEKIGAMEIELQGEVK